ncbi:MAG: ABC transporter substrate-binding protein [Bacteroidota bacterium]
MKRVLTRLFAIGTLVALVASLGAAAAQPQTTLELWTWKVAFKAGLEAVCKEYTKQTKVAVTVRVFQPDAAYTQRVTAAANAGELPDVVSYWAQSRAQINPGLVEMSNVIKSWGVRFLPGTLESCSINQYDVNSFKNNVNANEFEKAYRIGDCYLVPMDSGTFYTIYANKKLLKAAGVPAVAPKTFEELIDMMVKVKEKTKVPGFVYGGKCADLLYNWMLQGLLLCQDGVEGVQALATGRAKMSDPKFLAVLKAFETIGKKGLLMPGVVQTDIDPADAAFAAGKAAFSLGGTFSLASMVANGMNPNDVMTFIVPPLKGAKLPTLELNPFPLIGFGVARNSKHQKEAMGLIQFFLRPDMQALYARVSNDVPVIVMTPAERAKAGANVASFLKAFSPNRAPLTIALDYMNYLRDKTPTANLFGNLQAMAIGQKTAEAAAAQWDLEMAVRRQSEKESGAYPFNN